MWAMIQRRAIIRFAERAISTALVMSVPALIALWLTFQHKPGWYRPALLDEAGIQQARGEAVSVVDFVSDQMVKGRPFEMSMTNAAVNRWLCALPHIWPDAGTKWPPDFSEPAVSFESGGVRIGVHYARDGWRAIASVDLSLHVSDDGETLQVALCGVRGGSLPVPRAILDRVLGPHLKGARTVRDDGHAADDPIVAILGDVQSVEQLIAGVSIPNRFTWFNGRRPFRIESIEAVDGRLNLRIQPL